MNEFVRKTALSLLVRGHPKSSLISHTSQLRCPARAIVELVHECADEGVVLVLYLWTVSHDAHRCAVPRSNSRVDRVSLPPEAVAIRHSDYEAVHAVNTFDAAT